MRFQSSLVSLGERERNTGRARNQSRYAVLLLLLLLLLLFSKQHVPYATRYTRPGSCLNHFSRTENDRQQQDADQPSGSSSRLEARARESCASSRASTTMILWTHSIPFNKHKEKTSKRHPIYHPILDRPRRRIQTRSACSIRALGVHMLPLKSPPGTNHNSSRWGSERIDELHDPPEDTRRGFVVKTRRDG